MRPNIKLSNDDIMLAKLQRDLEIRQMDVQAELYKEDLTFLAYCVVFGIVFTGILLVLVYT
jgi:uncharacterized membrane protein (DUF106 family)